MPGTMPAIHSLRTWSAGKFMSLATMPPTESATVRGARAAGLAEALMRGGIGNYMSTYWPVRDDSANNFASTFYENLLAGRSIGQAMLAGRKAIDPKTNRDWADYVLYGSYDFILKSRHSPRAASSPRRTA